MRIYLIESFGKTVSFFIYGRCKRNLAVGTYMVAHVLQATNSVALLLLEHSNLVSSFVHVAIAKTRSQKPLITERKKDYLHPNNISILLNRKGNIHANFIIS